MGIIKRLKWKDKTGKTTDYDLGAKASNVEQDATHRFVSDTEKQTWNGKADPEDIPSGSAADYGVANNDTTNRTDMLVTAQVAYQHGKEIDQLNSEIKTVNVYVGSDGKLHFVNSGGADSVLPFSQKATITFKTELHSTGWGITRISKPDGYSSVDAYLSRGSGSVYGYTSSDTDSPYGANLGALTTSKQTFDVSKYVEIGIRVNGNNANAHTTFY